MSFKEFLKMEEGRNGGVQSIDWPEVKGDVDGPYAMGDKAYRLAQTGRYAIDAYSSLYSNFSHYKGVDKWLEKHMVEIAMAFHSHGLQLDAKDLKQRGVSDAEIAKLGLK